MTTQELYNKVLAEEVTQQKFLYEVRRDINLPFITSNNNFEDTVKILKNKGIISEKKLATGKQEVEIISKTIDMVNPYEYSRGMDYELAVVVDSIGNRVSKTNSGDSVHEEDITYEDVLKAQKKVLKNLTKNPNYYSQKLIPQMEGESEYEVEVNKKSIEALKKKAGKVIREHGEYFDKVDDVNPNVSPLEEDDKTQAFVLALDMYKNAKGTSDEKKALDNLEKVSQDSLGVKLPLEGIEEQQLGLFDDEPVTDFDSIKNLPFEDRQKILMKALEMFKNARGTTGVNDAKEYLVKVTNALGIPIKVDDLMEKGDTDYDRAKDAKRLGKKGEENIYGAGVKKGEEIAAKKMAAKREAIYEKYANEYGVDVNELKDRLEAYKLEKEAIEVEDEDTAISVQKKSPEADVRIVNK